jgi:formate dehydrogenase major subunit
MSVSGFICPFCGFGCKIYINKENSSISRAGCIKSVSINSFIKSKNRILTPLVRIGSSFSEASWNHIISSLALELRKIVKVYGGSSIAFIGGSKCSNEENYLFQKFARFIGSNNIDNCVRLCHAVSVDVLTRSLGFGAQTNPFSDLIYSKAILIIGYNPVVTHPPLASIILEAKKRGAKVMVVDVRKSETAKIADIFIQIKRLGMDYMLLLCMANIILSNNLYNREFLEKKTMGFEEFLETVKKYDPITCEKILDISKKQIEEISKEFAIAGRGSILWGMGVAQNPAGYNTVAAIVNLALLLGYIGKKGCGLYPVRGQNNVQGACDMGVLPNYLPGYESIYEDHARKRFEEIWHIDEIPSFPGYTSIEVFEEALKGKIKALFIVGENPLVSHPNSKIVEKALQNIEIVVVQDVKWNETTKYADYILASATCGEKEGSYTNSERKVRWSYKVFDPPGNAVPDWVIIMLLGEAMGLKNWRRYLSPEEILKEINVAVPIYEGITPERLKSSEDGLTWPCRDKSCAYILYRSKFETKKGKAIFNKLVDVKNEQNGLTLITYRLSECYNTSICLNSSIGSDLMYAIINLDDAKSIGIRDGDAIKIVTKCGEEIFHVKSSSEVPRGIVAIPWHAKTNIITCENPVNVSGTPSLKNTKILKILTLKTKKDGNIHFDYP